MASLKKGDQGPRVQLVQYILQLIGFNPGQINGIFDQETENAVTSFQENLGLIDDGIVGVETMEALEPYLLGYQEYQIQRGDTYASIAKNFGTSTMTIQIANPDINPQALVPGTVIIVPYGYDLVKTNVPYTFEVLNYDIRGLQARYPFIKVDSIGRSVKGNELYRIQLGKGPNQVTYNASHHSNEWITTPVLMKWIEEFLKSYVRNEPLRGYNISDIWNGSTIDIIPMVNPDGVDLVINGPNPEEDNVEQLIGWNFGNDDFSDWKSNINGVDLNRNYDAAWDEYKELEADFGVTGPGPALYAGKAPESQPEVKAMVDFTMAKEYRLTLAYHTQGQVIFWDFMNFEPPESLPIGEEFSKVSGYVLADPALSQSFAGYKDWFIKEFSRPGYTIEAGIGKNPLPLEQFGTIYEDNEELLLLASVI
ncbi:M14 family metallopeptidase [Vallitalea okinawensis]|uniref:M14 family metallopeptidase n=1 Tax=Vallitalea okinawensis TaxID=2078660 RepID=UPI000CFE329D|nr:M14 family metallopeptidase [Vallitalea okinawensis]